MEIHPFLGQFPRFLVDVLKDVRKLNSKFVLELEIRIRNGGQSYCEQKFSPDDFKSVATLSFRKMLAGK